MKKIILILLLILVMPFSQALEGKVAYISSSQGLIDLNFWNELESLGLDVEWVDSDFISYKDMTKFDMMFINNEFFSNANLIPVNKMPTLLATSWNLDIWSWADTSSSIASNSPLKANITTNNHPITSSYAPNNLIQIYDSCCEGQLNVQMLYLARLDRMPFPKKYPNAPGLTNLLGLEIDARDGVILTALPGTELRKGTISQSKGAFYGMIEITHWTNESKDLFHKTVQWLLTDEIPPTISDISTSDKTNESIKVNFKTNKLATSKIKYGLSNSFGNELTDDNLMINHSLDLTNLQPGKLYYYQIESCNKFDFCVSTATSTFTTMKNAPDSPSNILLIAENTDNSIIVYWGLANGAESYNIYTSDDPTNFNFNNPSATVTGTNYTDNAASASQKKFYVVRAKNNEGTEEKNTMIVGKFDLNLFLGANLVSLPLVPFDKSIIEVMHQDSNYRPVVMIKTLSNGQFVTSTFKTDNAPNFWTTDELTTIENNKAYYFVSQENTKLTIVGYYSKENQKINLDEGMNYIGLLSFSEFNLKDILLQDNSSYKYLEISQRNQDGSFDIATYYPSEDLWFSATGFNSLKPGEGYILKTNADAELPYSP